jgi:hypothetical protein
LHLLNVTGEARFLFHFLWEKAEPIEIRRQTMPATALEHGKWLTRIEPLEAEQ